MASNQILSISTRDSEIGEALERMNSKTLPKVNRSEHLIKIRRNKIININLLDMFSCNWNFTPRAVRKYLMKETTDLIIFYTINRSETEMISALPQFKITSIELYLQQTNHSPVDVSETFSADQLWFRTISGLFQRCSLPENLWAALFQFWTALISSETALHRVDFGRLENDNLWFIVQFFRNV